MKFTRSLITLSFLLIVISFCWNYFLPQFNSPHIIYIVLYFFVSIGGIHRFLIKANTQSPQNFVRSYIAFTALKLLLNLMVIILYIFINRSQAIVFILSFLILYFIFLVFEIISLQKELRNK